MEYLTIVVIDHPGAPFSVWDNHQEEKFESLTEILEHYAAQGWLFCDSLPQEWRLQKTDQFDAAKLTGLELAIFNLIFRKKEA